MNDMANKAIRLGVIGAVAALMLASVNHFTEPVIRERKKAELEAALMELSGGLPVGAMEAEPAEGVAKRWPIGSGQGWLLELNAVGYGGAMTVVASYAEDGEVISARLMDNSETVGFGKKAEDPEYMTIFAGKGGAVPLPRNKTELGDDLDTVSGATVTFNGINKAVTRGSALVQEWESR